MEEHKEEPQREAMQLGSKTSEGTAPGANQYAHKIPGLLSYCFASTVPNIFIVART